VGRAGRKPAIAGHRAQAGPLQPRDEHPQPLGPGPRVGIDERQVFHPVRQVLGRHQQIVNLLAAVGGPSGGNHARRHPRVIGHRAADRRICRIVGALHDKDDFEIVVVLPQQGPQVRLESRSRPLHGANSATRPVGWCGDKPRMQLRT